MKRIASALTTFALAGAMAVSLTACVSSSSERNVAQPDRAAEINLQLGLAHLRKGNLQLAKDKIDRALTQNPRNAQAQMAAGLLYDRLGEVRKADSHFERAVSLDSKDPELANNYAAFLCKNERFARGEKYALQAAENPLYKTPEVAFLNAGHCARASRDLTRAEAHYRRALAVQPRFAMALFSLAEVELEQQNYLSARAFLERYLSVARSGPATLWLGVQIERGLGNAATADQYAQRLKNEFPRAAETQRLLESERNPG